MASKQERKQRRIERAKRYSEYKRERDARNEGIRKAREATSKYHATEGQKKYGEILGIIQEYLDEEEYAAFIEKIKGTETAFASGELFNEFDNIYVKNNRIAEVISSINLKYFNEEMEEIGSPVRITEFVEPALPQEKQNNFNELVGAIKQAVPSLREKKENKDKKRFIVNEWGF